MRVKFLSSGGFAGIQRGADLSASGLNEQELEQLTRLVKSARSSKPKRATTRSAAPDAKQYRIEIAGEGENDVLEFADSEMTDPLSDLVLFLNARSKPVPIT